MKKRNLVVANWKMNPESFEEAKRIFNITRLAAKKLKNTDVIVCAPFVYLQNLSKLERSKKLHLGTQNISSEFKGAYTGEVSGVMIKNLDTKFVILGHSERRAMGESNDFIKKKIQAAYDTGITPILCIGEKTRDKEGNYLEFLKSQIKECLSGLQKKNLVGLVIAYEPIWAIGKSYKESMHPTDVHEMTLFIKKVAGEMFGKDVANSWKILYGGSVEVLNAPEIIRLGNVDGFLVGHASLKPEFTDILKIVDLKK